MKGGWGYVEGVGYVRYAADPYPDYSGAVCTNVKILPFSADAKIVSANEGYGSVASWEYARIEAYYGVPSYVARKATAVSVDGGSNHEVDVTESLQPTTEFITIPGTLYWDDAQAEPLDTNEMPGMVIKSLEWVVTYHDVRKVGAAFFDLLDGNISTTAHTSPKYNRSFAAKTLLYASCETSPRNNTAGDSTDDVTCHFLWRPDTWHKWPRPGTSGATWSYIYDENGDQVKLFTETSLAAIIPQEL
jgi:hypothetical protein